MSTARIFDLLYLDYDHWYEEHPVTARNELLVVGEALSGAPEPCVEVGVGTGWFASRLGCLLGVDPSLSMLRIARARGVEAVAGRGEALPLASSRLGTVLMVVTICFVDDPWRVVAEASRALVGGGRLVVCIVPRDSPWGRYYVSLASRGHPFYSHARFYTVGEVDEFARRAGLRRRRVLATLSYPPGAPERYEDPRPYTGSEGFACIEYSKD